MAFTLDNLAPRIAAYAREHALWEDGAHLLLAVSGGADSVAMLDVLAGLPGLQVTVGHVNHGLRPEAGEDAAFVQTRATAYGVPCLTATVDTPGRVADTGESVEEAARALRYEALAAMAREAGADRIATAHTADDQAETVLMRALRGTGVNGLAGIPPRRDTIVRPLLAIWRAEIEAYLAARNLPYRIDTSNLSTIYTRNRVRLDLLPLLERDYAPGLRGRLAQLADLARADAAALDGWAAREYARLCTDVSDGLALPADAGLPQAVQWRLWRQAIDAVRGGLADIGYEHVEDIAGLPPGAEVHLPGVRVRREGDRMLFLGMSEPACAIPETPLPVPGVVEFPTAGCTLSAKSLVGTVPIAGGNTALLDAAAVDGPLIVRTWQPGDRYRPLGAPGTRKLQDIFVDAGVPRRLRGRIPVVWDDHGICWLAGFRIADRVKMVATTQQTIRLNITWEYDPWTLHVSQHR